MKFLFWQVYLFDTEKYRRKMKKEEEEEEGNNTLAHNDLL